MADNDVAKQLADAISCAGAGDPAQQSVRSYVAAAASLYQQFDASVMRAHSASKC